MSINQDIKKRQDESRKRLDSRKPVSKNIPAVMGDGYGNLLVPGRPNFVYVTINNIAYPAFCGNIPPQDGKKVWVGVQEGADKRSRLYEVLSMRGTGEADANIQLGYAPSKRYEHNAIGGGQDVLKVHDRAITFLKVGTSPLGGMNAQIYRGRIDNGSAFINIPTQDIDLTAHIPTGVGAAAFVLITIDNTGAVIQTKGAEVGIGLLTEAYIPVAPSNTNRTLAAVRVYEGQTELREARVNTDFVELRFTGQASGGGAWGEIGGNIEDQTDLIEALVNNTRVAVWDYISLVDAKPSGTNGGSFTSGAWRTRDLNSELSDVGNHCSLASNRITLDAGVYICDISAPGFYCASHKTRLFNITKNITELFGTTQRSEINSTIGEITRSFVKGMITITVPTVFEVQHRCGTTRNTDGFGIASGFGEVEVYTTAQFWKVASVSDPDTLLKLRVAKLEVGIERLLGIPVSAIVSNDEAAQNVEGNHYLE